MLVVSLIAAVFICFTYAHVRRYDCMHNNIIIILLIIIIIIIYGTGLAHIINICYVRTRACAVRKQICLQARTATYARACSLLPKPEKEHS